MQCFPIRFTGVNRIMAVLGLTRRRCRVEVDAESVHVSMGWAFSTTVPRSTVRQVSADRGRIWGWGVHGWRGVWLVNGSSSGIVRIDLEPPGRARLLVVSVRVRGLRVAVDRPDALITALNGG